MHALSQALGHWTSHGNPAPAGRWIVKELDAEGVPLRLPVGDWHQTLRLLDEAYRDRPEDWPIEFDAVIESLFLATLRFARPGGLPVFGPVARQESRSRIYRGLAKRLDNPSLSTVLDWWFPTRELRTGHAPPPLPANSRDDRVLAILRANWLKDGDLIAVDHRAASSTTQFELNGLGRTWFGPSWTAGLSTEKPGRAKVGVWISQSSADFLEWSFKLGRGKLTRSVVSLRGRRIALLSELWEGPGDPDPLRLAIPEGIEATVITDCRGIALRAEKPKGSARVYPIGLPKAPYATEKGSLSVEGRALILKQAATGRRTFRTLLVSWEPQRHRQSVDWRNLTITEDGKTIGPDLAFAIRIRWGRDDTLLIYRNHGKPATRSFLGHQTKARFLVGLFTNEGTVQPLLKLDDESKVVS